MGRWKTLCWSGWSSGSCCVWQQSGDFWTECLAAESFWIWGLMLSKNTSGELQGHIVFNLAGMPAGCPAWSVSERMVFLWSSLQQLLCVIWEGSVWTPVLQCISVESVSTLGRFCSNFSNETMVKFLVSSAESKLLYPTEIILLPNKFRYLVQESFSHTLNDLNMGIHLFYSGKVVLLVEKILFLIINYLLPKFTDYSLSILLFNCIILIVNKCIGLTNLSICYLLFLTRIIVHWTNISSKLCTPFLSLY